MGASGPGTTAASPAAARQRSFLPALEGMRGLAALGVLVTHVAFQTGATAIPVLGRLLERFDMAVAVFFALSGFLLWRPHALAARGLGDAPTLGYYLRHRVARIVPAYWLVVCAVLILVPAAADTAGVQVWLSNLLLLQVFIPLTLTDGLTQMWSLSVEVAFYLVLPLLAWLLHGLRGRAATARVPAVLLLGLVFLGWNFIPVPTPGGIHADNWLPAYIPWFAGGMLLAELICDEPRARGRRILGNQRLMWAIAGVTFALSATDLGGVAGLTRAEPWQYAAKMALGTVIGFALLAPLVLGPADKSRRWLTSAPAATVGRWSYGIFIWHLAVLSVIFPVFGILPFHGDFVKVLVLTVAFTLPIAAASHALVEEPCRQWARRFDRRS
ncbi:acyltransferase family protein [Nocardia flavorosea]|uniref:Acyltransferase n=1 Tax=Nocardia flavorosea TaxID=53429 RepID=A0A846YMF7_9NOCA|nr:acyltransferase [Nocardia flavorosea]NKY60215.1 acyltransferase [Nocardia flavorosea]